IESDSTQMAAPSLARGHLLEPKNTPADTSQQPAENQQPALKVDLTITENLVDIRRVPHTFAADPPEKIATSTGKEPQTNEGLSDTELIEAHRIAVDLAKLNRDDVISGRDNPQAMFYATLVRAFRANYTVKRSPSADR